jgi:iron complex outermembrane receptor protein
MKRIWFILPVIIFSQAIEAQNEIWGKVTDTGGMALPGAGVYIPESQKGTLTDDDGSYRMNGLANGKFKVQYSILGYTTRVETIELDHSSTELNIVMEPSPVETEGIVVTGGYNTTQHENSFKIDVLKAAGFKTTGSPNLTGILTQVPGIDMISKGPGISKPVIRGLSMNDILVLNNGVRIENYQYSDHHPLGMDEAGVETVEIIKGPASLLYGSDAIGGVINFIKEMPAPVGYAEGNYEIGIFSGTKGIETRLGVKEASKNISGGLQASFSSHADFRQGGGQFVPNSRFNERSVHGNTGYVNKFGAFKIYYDYSHQSLGLSEEEAIDAVEPGKRKNEIWYQQFENHMISSQNKVFLNGYKLEVNAAYQNTALSHFTDTDEAEIQMALGTLTWESRIYFPSGRNSEYIAGVQGFHQHNKNIRNRPTILLPDAQTDNYSAFGLIHHAFTAKFHLQAGLRYDARTIGTRAAGSPGNEDYRTPLNRSFGSFSGSAGATFNASEKLLFRVNFSRAFRNPNLAELTSNGLHETRYELGNSGLVPEIAFESDLSMHYHTRNLTFDIAGFYNRISHYIFISPTVDTSADSYLIYRYLQSDARLLGAESGLHIHPKPIEWLHFEASYAIVVGVKDNGEYLPFIPAGRLNFELRIDHKKLWLLHDLFIKISPAFTFEQNHPSPEEVQTSRFTLINAGIGSEIILGRQHISWAFCVNNVFDTKYFDHLSTLKEVGFFDPGRNISLNLRIPFVIKNLPEEPD